MANLHTAPRSEHLCNKHWQATQDKGGMISTSPKGAMWTVPSCDAPVLSQTHGGGGAGDTGATATHQTWHRRRFAGTTGLPSSTKQWGASQPMAVLRRLSCQMHPPPWHWGTDARLRTRGLAVRSDTTRNAGSTTTLRNVSAIATRRSELGSSAARRFYDDRAVALSTKPMHVTPGRLRTDLAG